MTIMGVVGTILAIVVIGKHEICHSSFSFSSYCRFDMVSHVYHWVDNLKYGSLLIMSLFSLDRFEGQKSCTGSSSWRYKNDDSRDTCRIATRH